MGWQAIMTNVFSVPCLQLERKKPEPTMAHYFCITTDGVMYIKTNREHTFQSGCSSGVVLTNFLLQTLVQELNKFSFLEWCFRLCLFFPRLILQFGKPVPGDKKHTGLFRRNKWHPAIIRALRLKIPVPSGLRYLETINKMHWIFVLIWIPQNKSTNSTVIILWRLLSHLVKLASKSGKDTFAFYNILWMPKFCKHIRKIITHLELSQTE